MVSVPARRHQVAFAMKRGLSQRRACGLLSVARSAPSYESVVAKRDAPVVEAMPGRSHGATEDLAKCIVDGIEVARSLSRPAGRAANDRSAAHRSPPRHNRSRPGRESRILLRPRKVLQRGTLQETIALCGSGTRDFTP